MNCHRFTLISVLTLLIWGTVCGQTIRKIPVGELNIDKSVFLHSKDKLYATVPDDLFSKYANRLIVVNPAWGKVEKVFKIGFDPSLLAATSNEKYLYTVSKGPQMLKRFNVAEERVDAEVSLDASSRPVFLLPLPQKDNAVVFFSSAETQSRIQLIKDQVVQPEQISFPNPDFYVRATFLNDSSILAWNGAGKIFRIKVRSNGLVLEQTFENLPLYIQDWNVYIEGKLISQSGKIIDVSGVEPVVLEETLPVQDGARIFSDPTSPFFYFFEFYGSFVGYGYLKFRKSDLRLETKFLIPVNLNNPDVYTSEFHGAGTDRFMLKNHTFTHLYWACQSQLSKPIIKASGDLVRCPSTDTLFLQADRSNATEIFWSTEQTSERIAITQTGPYAVKYTDAKGCQTPPSDVVNVLFHQKPYIQPITSELGSFAEPIICKGKKVRLYSNGFGGEQWRWSTGATGQSISGSVGNYQVKLISTEGCESDWSPTFTLYANQDSIPTQPVIRLLNGSGVFCQGDTAKVQGPSGYKYYYWFGSSDKKPIAGVTFSTSVTLIVGNDERCLSERSNPLEVKFNPKPFAPTIRQEGNRLISSTENSIHEWLVNGVRLERETASTLTLKGGGFYGARVQNNGCFSSISNLISISGKTVAIDEPVKTKTLKIYPNPAREMIQLDFANEAFYDFKIQLYSIDGRKILEQNRVKGATQYNQVPVADLPPGLYLIEALAEDRRFVGRFTKW